MKTPNVVISTRLTQVLMMPAFILPVCWLAFMQVFSRSLFTIEFVVSSVMISVALLLIAREFVSESEVAWVEGDKIMFRSRKSISFDELKSFSFEDGITLRIKGSFFSLYLQCHNNPVGYSGLVDELRWALSERRKSSQASGCYMPRQTFFYGTWKARLIGYGFILIYALLTGLFAKHYLYW